MLCCPFQPTKHILGSTYDYQHSKWNLMPKFGKVVCVSFHMNALSKCMNPSLLLLAMGK